MKKKTWEEVVMVSVRMPQLVVVVVMVVVVRQWVLVVGNGWDIVGDGVDGIVGRIVSFNGV